MYNINQNILVNLIAYKFLVQCIILYYIVLHNHYTICGARIQ